MCGLALVLYSIESWQVQEEDIDDYTDNEYFLWQAQIKFTILSLPINKFWLIMNWNEEMEY